MEYLERPRSLNSLSRREFLSILKTTFGAAAVFSLDKNLGLRKFFPEEKNLSELIAHQEEEGTLLAQNTPVLVVPLRDDYFYDETRSLKVINLEGETRVGYKDLFILGLNEQNAKLLTILPHITGDKALYLASIGEGVLSPISKTFIETRALARRLPVGIVKSEFSYWDEVYPNKIINILVALRSLISYQESHGPFVAGREYSLLEMFSLTSNREFVAGRTSSGEIVRAGGVCAVATTLAKSLFLAGATFTEKWTHPPNSRYFVGPGDPRITKRNSDATVGIESDGNIYDLKWIMPQGDPLYTWIDAKIWKKPIKVRDELGPDADARLFFSISWSPTPPPSGQSEKISDLLASYNAFRREELSESYQSSVREFSWEEGQERATIQSIYPEERTDNYALELKQDRALKELDELRTLINYYSDNISYEEFNENPRMALGEYLRHSSWYQSREVDRELESALRFLNGNTYLQPNEAIQCVGWVVLMSTLGHTISPENIGGQQFYAVRDLIPAEIRERRRTRITRDGLVFEVIESLEDVRVGDLFLNYKPHTPGHIAAIIGKKEIDGKTVLLVTDANRKRDGRIRIFQVDESNFDAIFGEEPQLKILIRKT